MEILILFAIATALLWGLVCFRLFHRTELRPLPILGIASILAGSVVGYDFFHVQAGPIPLTIDRVLLLSLLAIFAIQFLRQREQLSPFNAMDTVVTMLLGMLLLSVFLHDWRFKENLPVSRLLFFYLFPVALYYAMRSARIGLAELQWIATAMIGLAVYLALTAVAETQELRALVFPKYILEPGEFFGRGRGPLLNPVINGILMTVGCCCLWMRWPDSTAKMKIGIISLSGLIALGVFLTFTRSVWLGFLASAALFIFYPAERRTQGKLWLAGVLMLVVSFPLVGEKIFSFKRDKAVTQTEMELSAKLRPMFLEVATMMFQDRPIFGCGFGQYSREKYAYLKDAHASQPLVMTRKYMQHNVFLAYLTESGLIGLGCLLLMLSTIAVQAWKLWSHHQSPLLVRLFGLLMLALLLNYTINGMFHDVSIIPLSNALLFCFAGIVNNLTSVGLVAAANPSASTIETRPDLLTSL